MEHGFILLYILVYTVWWRQTKIPMFCAVMTSAVPRGGIPHPCQDAQHTCHNLLWAVRERCSAGGASLGAQFQRSRQHAFR